MVFENGTWPTCEACGCRLEINTTKNPDLCVLDHFGDDLERDARGCKCELLNVAFLLPTHKVARFI